MPGTRQLIVTDLKHIKSGTTVQGDPYTLWQVRATDLGGIPIDQQLRTFDELPKNIPITVEVDYFESSRGYGNSFTLKLLHDEATAQTAAPSPPPPVQAPVGIQATLEDLVRRVAELEDEVQRLKGQRSEPRKPRGPQQAAW